MEPRCRVRALGPHAWAVEGAELGWLRCVVRELHAADAASDAAVLHEHPLDQHLVLRARPDAVPAAATAVAARLATLEATCDGRRGTARVRGTPPWDYANLLRRALLTRVPVLACTSAAVSRNDSSASSEVVAHRLGQVALRAAVGQGVGRGRLAAESRPARCSHIRLPEGVELVEDFELAPLRSGEGLQVELGFAWGVGGEHAKFDAVASPEYEPELRVEAGAEALRQAGYDVDAEGCVSHPATRVRAERLRELVPELALASPSYVDVTWESLGQWTGAECLELALGRVRAEIEAFVAALRELSASS